ncbi:MAG: DUF2061 domain-containing protein [Bacteroidota bacterium]|nr:DUF2061 domain-containing protein [Bacteroidota bacterium]
MKFSKRHFAKSLSWRLIGTVDTLVFAWLITGNLNEGLSISGITTFTKFVWYYLHEHFWFKTYVIDTNKRHIIKTFSWRVVGTLDTILFGWIITGNPLTGLKIGGIETASKMLLYFAHEKLWYKINFGLDTRKKAKRLKNHQVDRNATKI